MKTKRKTEKKMFALFSIVSLLFLTFLISFALSSTFATAQTVTIGVCLRSDGACDSGVKQSDCEGAPNYEQLALKKDGTVASLGEIPGCQPGCCVFKKNNQVIRAEWAYYKRQCTYLSTSYNMDVEITDDNYDVCIDKNPKTTQGYCRTLESCFPSTKENCVDGDFSSTPCPNCRPDAKIKCDTNTGDVYYFDSCDIKGARVDECNMNVEHCENKNSSFAQCVPSTCTINLNFTTLAYDTILMKSGQIKIYSDSYPTGHIFDANSKDNIILSEAQTACVQYQGPGERHYIYTCMNGVLAKEALNSDRKEICYWDSTNGIAKNKTNDYTACGQCDAKNRPSGTLADAWNWVAQNAGLEVLNFEWMDYNGLFSNPGLCNRDACEKISSDCAYVENDEYGTLTNDCVPEYAPVDGNLCTECMSTKASSPWDKCTSEACMSRSNCVSGKIQYDVFASATICTMETFLNEYLSSFIDGLWKGTKDALKNGFTKLGGFGKLIDALIPDSFGKTQYELQQQTEKATEKVKEDAINNKIETGKTTTESVPTPSAEDKQKAAAPAQQPAAQQQAQTPAVQQQAKTPEPAKEVRKTSDVKDTASNNQQRSVSKIVSDVKQYYPSATDLSMTLPNGKTRTYNSLASWEKWVKRYPAEAAKIPQGTTFSYSVKGTTKTSKVATPSGKAAADIFAWEYIKTQDHYNYVADYSKAAYSKLVKSTTNGTKSYKEIVDNYFKTQSENGWFLNDRLSSIVQGKIATEIIGQIFIKLPWVTDILSPTALLKKYLKKWACQGLAYFGVNQATCTNSKFPFPIIFCTIESAIESGATGIAKRNACTAVSSWEMNHLSEMGDFNMCHLCDEDSSKVCDQDACYALSPNGPDGCSFVETGEHKCIPNPSAYCNTAEGKGKIAITTIQGFNKVSEDSWQKDNVAFITISQNVTINTNKNAECKYFTTKDAAWDKSVGTLVTQDIYNKLHFDTFDVSDYEKRNFTYYVRCKDYCGAVGFTNMTKVTINKGEKPDEMGPIIVKQYPAPKMLLEGFKTGEKNEISIEIKTDEKSQCKFKPYPLAGSAKDIIGYYEQITKQAQEGINQGKTEEDVVASIPSLNVNWTDTNMTMMNASDNPSQTGSINAFNHKALITNLVNNKTYAYAVLCMDAGSHVSDRTSFINFKVSELFSISITAPTGTITEKEPEIRVTTDRDTVCRYIIDKDNATYAIMSEFEKSGQQDHRTKVGPALAPRVNDYNLMVRCVDQINENIAKTKSTFKLNLDTLNPKIIRVYKKTGDIQDTLYIATDEPTSCQYERKVFTYGKGIDMTNNEPASFEHEAAWGTETYYIICKDRDNNAALAPLVVNPYEIEIM